MKNFGHLEGLDKGFYGIWQSINERPEITVNVTLCPILSDKYPNNGARNIEIKKTFSVILAASVCENPYLTMKNSFDMLLKQNNPTYIKPQNSEINQKDQLSSFKLLQRNSSFSSLASSVLICLSIFSACFSNHAVIKELN